MRCLNALCNEPICRDAPHLVVDVVGVVGCFCDKKCLEEWERQNMIFRICTDPNHPPIHRTRKWYDRM